MSIVAISEQELHDPVAYREKLVAGCKRGFFYVEMPEECRQHLAPAIEFANSFYKERSIRELKFEGGGYSGYVDRRPKQIESFYCERPIWNQPFFSRMLPIAEAMMRLSIEILQKALEVSQIPSELWSIATGGAVGNRGLVHLNFNHYRPEIEGDGVAQHADFGAITLLFINKPGLRARIGEGEVDVDPLESHFVVNFGQALQTFVNDPSKLTAAQHYVRHVSEDRISFALFNDNHVKSPVLMMASPTTQAFYDRLFQNTYPSTSA